MTTTPRRAHASIPHTYTSDYHLTPARRNPTLAKPSLLPLAGWVLVVISATFAAIKITPTAHGDDWSSLYIGGMLAGQGNWHEAYAVHPHDFSLTDSEVWEQMRQEHTTVNVAHPFVHNPGVALFMAVFSNLFSFTETMYILTFISGACAPLIPAAAYKFWTSKTISWPYLIAGTLMVWISEPFLMSLQLGQTSPLILTSCMLALALAKDNPVMASLMLSLATFVKLTPIIVIAGLLFIPSTRRAGIYTALMAGAWFSSLIVVLHDPIGIWIESLKEHGSAFLVSPINAAISSVIYAPMRTNEGVAIVTDVSSSPVTFVMGIVISVTGLVFLNAWRKSYKFPEESFLMLCLLGPMCVASILWIHYSVVLIFPLIGILVRSIERRNWWFVTATVVCSAILVVPFDFAYPATWNPVMVMHLGLWIFVVVMVAGMGCRDALEKPDPVSFQRHRYSQQARGLY